MPGFWSILHMKKHWYYFVLAALAVAALCIFAELCLGEQGYYRFRLFGSVLGFGRVDATTFVFFRDVTHRFEFPFDRIILSVAFVAVCIAVFIAVRHFRSQKSGF
jgi:hypothetical protein